MTQQLLARRTLIAAVLILGVCAWIVVGGVVLMDSVRVVPTPTEIKVAIKPSNTASATTAPTVVPATITPTELAVIPTVDTPVPSITAISTDPATEVATANAVNGCNVPAGWVAYSVEDGDTLFGFSLGSKGQLSVDAIMAGNCMQTKLLSVGQTIFLPKGVAEQSPKVDSGAGGTPLPAGLTRTAHCPCTITMRPGLRVEQVAAAVDAVPVGFTGADFLKTVAPGAPTPDLPFLHSRPAGISLEGFMFPGTYTLDNSTSAVQFRDMLLNAFGAAVSPQVQNDAAANGLTFWQVINLASIVQRESGSTSEQKLIASVFYNRMAANKGLASSVTMQYALGHPGNWWPRLTAGAANSQSPYNTNLRLGLPPSPIASPGLDAILATVYPAKTSYQYFSAKCGGGGNFYATTYAEFTQGLKCN